MACFTPGPWKVAFTEDGEAIICDAAKESVVLSVECYGRDFPQFQANIRLMAAAPKMYEILKAINLHLEAYGEVHTAEQDEDGLDVPCVTDLRAVIEEMEGKQE